MNMPNVRPKVEQQHHREAFEMYYMMNPDKRSMREVARQVGKAASTVQGWAKAFNWEERVQVRDAQVARQFSELQQRNNDTLVEIKASFHKVLKALIADAIESIKKKRLGIEDVNDLLKVMKLDLELLGEEDRKAQAQLNDLTEALKASVNMFGGQAAQWTYDGNDRIEGDDNDDDTDD
jgi:hypothetical protein